MIKMRGSVTLQKIVLAQRAPKGAMLKIGTSSSYVTSATADVKFLELYAANSATSGDNRLAYLRFRTTGAGGGGEALRAYHEVYNVAGGTAHGAHLSLGFGASGQITGLGAAVRATLHIPDAAMAAGGTYCASMHEIYTDGSSSDPAAVTELAFLRIVAGGDGKAAVDDKAYLLVLDGVEEGAGNMVVASTTETNYASAARCKINGVEKWLMFASASG